MLSGILWYIELVAAYRFDTFYEGARQVEEELGTVEDTEGCAKLLRLHGILEYGEEDLVGLLRTSLMGMSGQFALNLSDDAPLR